MLAVPKKLGRRELGRAALGLGLGLGLPGCSAGTASPKPPGPPVPLAARSTIKGAVEVWSVFDLPIDDPRSRELSGATWDPETRTLWCVQDELATIIPLRPDAAFKAWRFGETIK